MAEDVNSEKYWWNKLRNMSEEELDLMPYGFIKKYGTFLTKIREY